MKTFAKGLLMLAAGIVAGACTQEVKDPEPFKVISYNIRQSGVDDGENNWQLRRDATITMIETEAPAIVGMQEVLADQYEFVKENCPDYEIVGVGRDDRVMGGEMMAVLYLKSRFEKLEEGHFWLSETPEEVSCGWDGHCNRMVTWVRLKDRQADKELYFFNTHLDHAGPEARLEGSNLIASRMKAIAKDSPAILTGDFNANPHDPVLAALNDNYLSARNIAARSDIKITFNGFGTITKGMVIDHIYYTPGQIHPTVFRTLDGDYGKPYISDHYPVEAVFEWVKPADAE